MTDPLLEVRDLRVEFRTEGRRRGREVTAVDGVSLALARGEVLGLVGESGSGKSTIGNAILGLVRPTAGEILFDGEDITFATVKQRRHLSRRIQVVFQDPYSSLNPSRTVGETLVEPLRLVRRMDARKAGTHVLEMLSRVGMPPDAIHRYPAAFSGGQRQRIAIARALVLKPRFLVLDEPTSALDVSVQAQIVDLLRELQARHRLAYLFISHDLKVVRALSDDVLVLRDGRVVEHGPTAAIFACSRLSRGDHQASSQPPARTKRLPRTAPAISEASTSMA